MISLLCLVPFAFAEDNWGIGLRGGAAQNNPDYEEFVSKNYGVFGAEGFWEHRTNFNLGEGEEFLGIKLGADFYGKNKLDDGTVKATENSHAFPLTVYYKNDLGVEDFSSFIGAGITSIKSKAKGSIEGSKSKVFPHLMVGAEYRLNWLVALGLEIKYNINAKVKKDGYVISDRSGISGAVTARFYF